MKNAEEDLVFDATFQNQCKGKEIADAASSLCESYYPKKIDFVFTVIKKKIDYVDEKERKRLLDFVKIMEVAYRI